LRLQLSFAIAACAALLCACQPASPDSSAAATAPKPSTTNGLEFRDAWVRATPGGSTAAAYFTLLNHGPASDTLLSAASPVAAAAQMHLSSTAQGTARMRPAGELLIPVGGQLDITPAGLHVMLTGLSRPLMPGESVSLTLTFRRAGTVTLTMPVRGAGGEPHLHASN
jgi:copper(I)-binding protein